MKRLVSLLLSALAFVAVFLPFGGERKVTSAATSYILRDDFGAAPLVRTISENMERVELNDVHKPYTKYGFGVRLKSESEGREYITYELSGVNEIDVTAIVRQSNFGANHGWGLSLGVTDEVNNMPLNNTSNINLQNVFPIYLSTDGKPFIFTENRWWGYIAGQKYSFVPSMLDIPNQLRPFTVPNEVQGTIDTDGFTILKKGFLYPMINAEYCVEGSNEWVPMVLDANSYRISAATFLGGDKEYSVTVHISNVPEAAKIRIGTDYIRRTLKPASSADSEADVYENFPVPYDEGIYLTGVKFTMSEPYNGGFETLTQTGIAVDKTAAKVRFAYGEQFSADGLAYYDVLGDGIKEQSFDENAFTLDSSKFNRYQVGIYQINAKKEGYESASYYVEVMRPDELIFDLSEVNLKLSEKKKFSAEKLKVTAKTNIGTVNAPEWKEIEVPAEYYAVDDSAVNYKKAGEYEVKVTVGEGFDEVSGVIAVTVEKNDSVLLPVVLGIVGAVVVAGGVTAFIVLRKRHEKK
ncbi:MAG: hypothetical protein IJY62_03685 [Clostridia bacterium]|nr:hypothetical protein [Clostridia bacterium]